MHFRESGALRLSDACAAPCGTVRGYSLARSVVRQTQLSSMTALEAACEKRKAPIGRNNPCALPYELGPRRRHHVAAGPGSFCFLPMIPLAVAPCAILSASFDSGTRPLAPRPANGFGPPQRPDPRLPKRPLSTQNACSQVSPTVPGFLSRLRIYTIVVNDLASPTLKIITHSRFGIVNSANS